MKKYLYGSLGFVLVFSFLIIGSAGTVRAEVNVNINIGPPVIVESEPPEVVMMPRMGIYFVPSVSFDVFFYNGYWWSPRGDRWYRARQYKGPWGVIQRNSVPGPLFKVPKNYREVYKQEKHINYKQWRGQPRNGAGNKQARPANNGQRGRQAPNNEGRGRGGKH